MHESKLSRLIVCSQARLYGALMLRCFRIFCAMCLMLEHIQLRNHQRLVSVNKNVSVSVVGRDDQPYPIANRYIASSQ